MSKTLWDESSSRPVKVTSEILDRQPPISLEAELCTLGSILLLPDVCDDVALVLRAEDFYDDANRKLYEHLLAMHDSGRKIDFTLLVEQLKSSGDYETIGGAPFLGKVFNSVPNAAHAVYYANIVREKALYRSLIEATTDILREAYDEERGARESLSNAEQRIFGITDGRGDNQVAEIRDVLHDAMDRLDARMRGEQTASSVETGFTELDAITSGLHESELIILAARPGMGKTALAMNIAEHVSIEMEVPVLFVSLEMGAIELAERLLCSRAKVNGHRLRNGSISNDERRELVRTAGEISEAKLFVDDTPSRTVTEIAAASRRIRRREERLGLIVIDYLQLLEPDNPKDPRQEQVAKIARRLKGLAREMKVPVLCLAQLNRQAEDNRDHVPRLSHLRESGAIEQDADVVMFIHREEYFRRGDERDEVAGEAEIHIAKQRNGPVDKVDLLWRKEYTRFENRAPDRLSEFDDYNSTSNSERF